MAEGLLEVPCLGELLGRLSMQLHALLGARDLERLAQDAHHVLGATGGLVLFLQALESAGANRVVGVLAAPDAFEHFDDAVASPAGLEERFDLRERAARLVEVVEIAGGDALVRREDVGLLLEVADAAVPELDQVGPLTFLFEEALESRGEALVLLLQRKELLHVADGADRVAGEVLGDVGGLVEERRARVVVGGCGERAVVEGQEIVEATGRGVDDGEALERPVRRRILRQDRVEDLDQMRRVFPEPLLEKVHRALTESRRQRRLDVSRDHVAVELGHFVRALTIRCQIFQRVPCILVGRVRARVFDRLCERLVRHLSSAPDL